MKKLILLLLLCNCLNSNAQSNVDLQKAVNNYAAVMLQNFTHGTELFKGLMITSLQQLGYYRKSELLKGMEMIEKDQAFREATYRVWKKISLDARSLKLQFTSIGMTDRDAEIMGDYVARFNREPEMFLSNKYDEKPSVPIALSSFTNLVFPEDDGKRGGKIAVRITVDKNGQVIDATPGVKGTTNSDRDLWQKCKEALLKSSLKQTQPVIRSEVVVFDFKMK